MADYWGQRAVELQEQLDEANERIAELEHELRVEYDDPGYTIDEGVIDDG